MSIKMKSKKENLVLDVDIPDGVDTSIENNIVTFRDKNNTISRKFNYPNIRIKKENNKIVMSSGVNNKTQKSLLGTIRGHIKNMIRGISSNITYKLKIVYAHFPINVKVQGNEFVINNFLGERHPRKAKILGNVKVEVKGQDIVLTGIDKENVSQTAANIEQATKIKDRDPRVFQDGIYIVEKDGKPIV